MVHKDGLSKITNINGVAIDVPFFQKGNVFLASANDPSQLITNYPGSIAPYNHPSISINGQEIRLVPEWPAGAQMSVNLLKKLIIAMGKYRAQVIQVDIYNQNGIPSNNPAQKPDASFTITVSPQSLTLFESTYDLPLVRKATDGILRNMIVDDYSGSYGINQLFIALSSQDGKRYYQVPLKNVLYTTLDTDQISTVVLDGVFDSLLKNAPNGPNGFSKGGIYIQTFPNTPFQPYKEGNIIS